MPGKNGHSRSLVKRVGYDAFNPQAAQLEESGNDEEEPDCPGQGKGSLFGDTTKIEWISSEHSRSEEIKEILEAHPDEVEPIGCAVRMEQVLTN